MIGIDFTEISRTVCCCRKLPAGGEAVCHESLEKNGVEVRTREIDGCGVSCGARADDHLHRDASTSRASSGRLIRERLTTLECIFELLCTVLPFAPFVPFNVGAILGLRAGASEAAAAMGIALKSDLTCEECSVKRVFRYNGRTIVTTR